MALPLPFLTNRRQSSGTITVHREPDDKEAMDKEAPLKAAAQDILQAVEQNDPTHLALALRNAWSILESEEEPSDDQEPSPHTYENQKG